MDIEHLTISHGADSGLVAVQTSGDVGYVLFIPGFLIFGGMVFSLITRRWRLALAAAVAILTICIAGHYAKSGPVYQAFIDPQSRSVSWHVTERGKERDQTTVRADQIETANVESRQAGSRVFVLRKDGTVAYPLGESFRMGEPEQFVVADAIRSLVQAGTHPQ